ncbi:MAG: N-acetyltransferase [Dehalococcoidia bacterium]|nr:N-acetyltransferase [Dehalococcoidia bacterium]
MVIAKAQITDVPQIHRLINKFASRGELLARALSEIYENVRDFSVARDGEEIVACAALHINWSNLAEIRSLAVLEKKQNQKIGTQVMKICLEEANNIGISTIFCLTYKPHFFEKIGFRMVDKSELPQKVWTDCYRCPKFPECDEVAMIWPPDALINSISMTPGGHH